MFHRSIQITLLFSITKYLNLTTNALRKSVTLKIDDIQMFLYDGYQAQSDNVSDKMKKVLNDKSQNIKYRHSAEKIELMTRRFEEDGFTSYWL